ncbi:MAG: peptidase U32 family protein [Bacteroidales bacterium]
MSKINTHKPELLLPAGTTESFYAALEAGADAIYLGAKQFNARERAANFTPAQLKALTKYAHTNNTAVYITLNTVIKNNEFDDLLNVLYQLQQIKPDALIIQDWAAWYIVKHHFPELNLHASTQMANHNSEGTMHAKNSGLDRVIMARELTMDELRHISKKPGADLEVFVHGALCYSFSGMCLFSSYLGGMSANRGQCKQACRRIYHGNIPGFLFSLKDNQAIDYIPELAAMGIASLKVEGRMKPAEYVYRVGKAYRMAIDDHNKISEAKALLDFDLGREKTAYFMGGNISNAISDAPATGKYIGNVTASTPDFFEFKSHMEIGKNSRLRIVNQDISEHISFKVKKLEKKANTYRVYNPPEKIMTGDEVYLSDIPGKKFPSRYEGKLPRVESQMPERKRKTIKQTLQISQKPKKTGTEIICRIDQISWLPKIDLRNINILLLDLSRKEWPGFNPKSGLIQKFKNKIAVEFPKFIPENQLAYYHSLAKKMYDAGIRHFAINHMSQKLLCPAGAKLIATENLYNFSDVAILALKKQGVHDYIRPLENDFNNLVSGKDRQGIIPVYFHPHLFISRMPAEAGDKFSERTGEQFLYRKKDGISYVIPEHPVSFTQYRNKLSQQGFYRFLIDLSFTKPSSNRLQTITKRLLRSQQIQPSGNFNFKMGLT